MAIYQGQIEHRADFYLLKDGVELMPRRWTPADAHQHFYFNWGNAGSGAHQLAMTLLVEEGLSIEEARSLHHTFCLTFLAMLDSTKDWELTSKQCQDIIAIVRISNRNMGFSNRA